jgi:hypothetical protein
MDQANFEGNTQIRKTLLLNESSIGKKVQGQCQMFLAKVKYLSKN